jgi:hypothetical protein
MVKNKHKRHFSSPPWKQNKNIKRSEEEERTYCSLTYGQAEILIQ